jgi:hypothetical protein
LSKIARKTALLFGSTSGANQIAQYGSLANTTPNFSTDPAVIQALSQWLQGWFSAVVGSNSPAIEDMNAFCYVMAYQISYLMQEGVAEWDSGTTYYAGSIAQIDGAQYISVTNANIGNNPVGDTTGSWQSGSGIMTNLIPMLTSTMQANSGNTFYNLSLGSTQSVTVPATGCLISYNSLIVASGGNLTVAPGGQARVI